MMKLSNSTTQTTTAATETRATSATTSTSATTRTSSGLTSKNEFDLPYKQHSFTSMSTKDVTQQQSVKRVNHDPTDEEQESLPLPTHIITTETLVPTTTSPISSPTTLRKRKNEKKVKRLEDFYYMEKSRAVIAREKRNVAKALAEVESIQTAAVGVASSELEVVTTTKTTASSSTKTGSRIPIVTKKVAAAVLNQAKVVSFLLPNTCNHPKNQNDNHNHSNKKQRTLRKSSSSSLSSSLQRPPPPVVALTRNRNHNADDDDDEEEDDDDDLLLLQSTKRSWKETYVPLPLLSHEHSYQILGLIYCIKLTIVYICLSSTRASGSGSSSSSTYTSSVDPSLIGTLSSFTTTSHTRMIFISVGILLFIFYYYIHCFIQYCFRENDHAVQRRQLYETFISHENEHLPILYRQLINNDPVTNVHYETKYWKNARGMLLNTVILTPKNHPIKAIICFCHGYSDNISYSKLMDYSRLVKEGNIAFVGIEYEGHGLSDGSMAYIENWNHVIDDISTYFTHITASHPLFRPPSTSSTSTNNSSHLMKNIFLMGESMGGAVAYDVFHRIPQLFRGVLFVCPMCKISDDMLPSPIIIDCFKRLIEIFPWIGYLPIAPSKQNMDQVTYKCSKKLHMASLSPFNYQRKPRLCTARELIDTTIRLTADNDTDTITSITPTTLFNNPNSNVSFIILHGTDDVVTDPELSKQLYEESKCLDKTLKLYDAMWHSLLGGEPDENVTIVIRDMIEWIHERI